MAKRALLGLMVAAIVFLAPMLGQFKLNFPDRKAIMLDICPT